MFSLDNFYNIIHANLLDNNSSASYYFKKFNSTFNSDDAVMLQQDKIFSNLFTFIDQEPFSQNFIFQVRDRLNKNSTDFAAKNCIVVTSEKSHEKNIFFKNYPKIHDWYYFCHGLIALEWYRDYQYFPKVENQFTKVFISLNHLITKDRSYRLNLVANYIEQGILNQGYVSLPLSDVNGTVKSEIFNTESQLSKPARKLILKNILPLSSPLTVDTDFPIGTLSAQLNIPLHQSALWNVVSETVFYHDKLHLTEKIFKPIVARRPFILVAAPGNLAYLKSYGFKTFDQWIDESYDTIQDPDQRIQAIVCELKQLCQLSQQELETMHQEMQEIFDYNFNHFYGKFKEIVITEMLDNFKSCVGQLPEFDLAKVDLNEVKKRWLR